jgi:hypothetical protein
LMITRSGEVTTRKGPGPVRVPGASLPFSKTRGIFCSLHPLFSPAMSVVRKSRVPDENWNVFQCLSHARHTLYHWAWERGILSGIWHDNVSYFVFLLNEVAFHNFSETEQEGPGWLLGWKGTMLCVGADHQAPG